MKRNKIKLLIVAACFFVVTLICWFKAPDTYSDSERRNLSQKPEFSTETVLSGEYMSEFESYALDQFPFREKFRTMKALSEYYLFGKKDNNGIYLKDGFTAKLEYPLNVNSLKNATTKFTSIYEKYLKDTGSKVYLSIIPDKGYFMAEANGYPSLDYGELVQTVTGGTEFAEYIDIFGLVALEDYYKTDTHWRQENVTQVAENLLQNMNVRQDNFLIEDLEEVTATEKFEGVYYGQSALPLTPEPLNYLTNNVIEGCKTFNFETGKDGMVYDTEKLTGREPYDVFVSGASALITIENPDAKTDRELIFFRDSFGSSLAPLMLSAYSKITLVDIRYIQQDYIGQLVEFKGQDVLFMYGTILLNDSYTFK